MRHIAQLLRQRRPGRLFAQFHAKKLSRRDAKLQGFGCREDLLAPSRHPLPAETRRIEQGSESKRSGVHRTESQATPGDLQAGEALCVARIEIAVTGEHGALPFL